MSHLNKPHVLLDLSDGLGGDNLCSLSAIGEDIGDVLGLGGEIGPPLSERPKVRIDVFSEKLLAINATNFGGTALRSDIVYM